MEFNAAKALCFVQRLVTKIKKLGLPETSK